MCNSTMPDTDTHKLNDLKQKAIELIKKEHTARNMLACITGCIDGMTTSQTYDEEFMSLTTEALGELLPFIEELCALVHKVRDA
jgi:hypothetical protein